ncbi:MAG: rhodanese-like domain-containing protein, partial [Methylacidiphilales bacterium]|nr:rhodanese-like domain-containing protein [Candidatus Methylacidiphilales bacterium]
EKIRSLIRQDSPCVLICGSGNRARQAAEKLQSAGISQTIILEGGIKACEAISLPLNRGKKTLSIERQVRIAAGTLVLLGAILSLTVHPAFAYLAAFVGAGLIFAGVTDWCGMALLLARMPWNQASPSCGCASEKKPLSA